MEGEGEREKHRLVAFCTLPTGYLASQLIWPATQACALTRNQTGDFSVHGLMLNPLSHTSQGNVQSYFVLVSGVQHSD